MKTMYRHEGGKLVSRKVSDAQADELAARGWLSAAPEAVEEEPTVKKRTVQKAKANDDKA